MASELDTAPLEAVAMRLAVAIADVLVLLRERPPSSSRRPTGRSRPAGGPATTAAPRGAAAIEQRAELTSEEWERFLALHDEFAEKHPEGL